VVFFLDKQPPFDKHYLQKSKFLSIYPQLVGLSEAPLTASSNGGKNPKKKRGKTITAKLRRQLT